MEKTFYTNKNKRVNAEIMNVIIKPIIFLLYEEQLDLVNCKN